MSTFCQPGTKTADTLLEAYASAEEVFKAPKAEIEELKISDEAKRAILAHDLNEAKRIQALCMRQNIGLLPYDCELFPALLKKIEKKPILLYYRGALPDFNNTLCVSIVGTRKCTDYGKRNTYTLSYDLAKSGAIVVSGMAIGIDREAHVGALDAGGKTVGILGNGLDIVYPKENYALYENVRHFGTLLTEYPPGTRAFPGNFPARNRLISGISRATVIIEADLKSGAMITAHTADQQGRDIFALPGDVGESNSRGTNSLIRDGAKIVLKTQDILDLYEADYPGSIIPNRIGDYIPRTNRGFAKVAAPLDHFDSTRPLREEVIEYHPIEMDENMNIKVLPRQKKVIQTRQRSADDLMKEFDDTYGIISHPDSRPPIERPLFDPFREADRQSGEALSPHPVTDIPPTSRRVPEQKPPRKTTSSSRGTIRIDNKSNAPAKPRPDASLLEGYESEIYNFMKRGVEYHVDVIHEGMGISDHSLSELIFTLSSLEIKNYVIALPGKRFRKV